MSSNETINSRLREAAARDDVESVRVLIAQGADPYDTDEHGYTAFNRSASNGLNALAYLTEIAFEDTRKPVEQRRWKDYGMNTPSGYYQSTLITYAAKVSPVSLVDEMISAGADIGIVNGSGWTLLHCAAVMPGRLEVLKTLKSAFAAQNRHGLADTKSTHVYETDYNGHKVVYGAGLTAGELCRARLAQDPQCPNELAAYPACL